jgi:hypothetical protein
LAPALALLLMLLTILLYDPAGPLSFILILFEKDRIKQIGKNFINRRRH